MVIPKLRGATLHLWAALVLAGLAAACGDGREDAGRSLPGADEAGAVASVEEASAPAPSSETRSSSEGSRPRVVILGNSLTAGYGLEDPEGEAWGGRLQFLADSAGLAVEFVNAGVSGETTAGGLRRIDWVLREPLVALVVELGGNDGLRGLPTSAMEANLAQIFRSTRDRYPEARLFLTQMEAPTNMGPAYTSAFRTVYDEVAEDQGATLIPFILVDVAGIPALNQADGIHPTPEGHDLMARAAWPYLERELRQVVEERQAP